MNTTVLRIPIVDTTPLDQRIVQECEVRYAAGYKLAGSFSVDDQIILIFQK